MIAQASNIDNTDCRGGDYGLRVGGISNSIFVIGSSYEKVNLIWRFKYIWL